MRLYPIRLTMGTIFNRKYDLEVTYYGSFAWGDGYGTSNMHWVKYLDRAGVKVFPYFTFEHQDRYSLEGDVEEQEILNRAGEIKKIGIIETPPTFMEGCGSEIKIGSTMTEADRICDEWVVNCNSLDYLILPNNWQKEVFQKCGVKTPIWVIPFGSEVNIFKYKKRPKRKIFTFGTIGYMMPTRVEKDRKNFWKLIQAFISEFEPDEPVRLLIKSSSLESGFYKYWKDPRIILDNKRVSREELRDIYYQMDCFVFPSRGEGVGQPPREAMATGLPCILTNWSSLTDVALPEISYPLSYTLSQRVMPEEPGMWADVDVRELMYYMRYVYEHRDEAMEKGKRASEFMNKNYTWEQSAEKLKEYLIKL